MTTHHHPLRSLSLEQLRARTSAKWQRYDADVLPLFVAEMDVALAPPVRDALAHAIATGDTGYREGRAYEESLVSFASSRWEWPSLKQEHIRAVPDIISGYVDASGIVTEPGDAVVVTPPVYPPFFSYVRASGRRIVEAPLAANMRLDLDALEHAFVTATAGGRAAAFLLCNPHNPGGTLHTREELTAVASLAREHGVRVIADEIHAPLVYSGESFTPYLSVPGGEDGFSLMSASKGWNLAGLPAGLMIAGTDSTEDLASYASEPHAGPSQLGALAQTVAYTQGGPWLADLLADLEENQALLTDLLAQHLPEVPFARQASTYLAWLDFTAFDLGGQDPSAFLLEHARVALNSGPTFGAPGAGFARLNFATTPDILTEAIERIARAVHS